MKTSKFKWIVLLIIIPLIAFSSCNNDDDGYSLDSYWVSIATVNKLDDGEDFSLKLDDAQNLWIAASWVHYYRPRQNQRTIINYTILSDKNGIYDHYIRLNNIRNILTKNAIDLTVENADSIGNDKIKILDIWSGGDFLNIKFGFNYGGYRQHMLNLVNNTTIQNPNDGKIYLEFKHNAYNDPEIAGSKGLVCFDLKPYRKGDKPFVEFVIKVNSFEGEKIYNVKYEYINAVPVKEISKSDLEEITDQGYI